MTPTFIATVAAVCSRTLSCQAHYLPGTSVAELAAEARALRPATLIVYATGDPSAVRGEQGAIVVSKPYDAAKLARAIASAQTEDSASQDIRRSETSGENEEV